MNNSEKNQSIEQADKLYEQGELLFQQHNEAYCTLFEKASLIYREQVAWEKYLQCQYKLAFGYFKRNSLKAAKEIATKSILLWSQKFQKHAILEGDFYSLLSSIGVELEKYNESLENIQKALIIYTALGESQKVIEATLRMGVNSMYSHKYNEALSAFHKALVLQKKQNPNELERNYYWLASVYYGMRQYHLAKIYCQRAIFSLQKKAEKSTFLYAKYKGFKGQLLFRLRDYTAALEVFQESDILLQSLKFEVIARSNNFVNIGKIYAFQGNWSATEEYFRRAIEINTKVQSDNHRWYFQTFSHIGDVYYFTGKFDNSRKYFDKALEINQTFLSANTYNFAHIYLRLAILMNDQGDLKGALSAIEKSVENWEKTFSTENKFDDPQGFTIYGWHLQIVDGLYSNTKNKIYLEQSLDLISYIQQQVGTLRVVAFQEGDLLHINQFIRSFNILAINVLYKKYLLEATNETLETIFDLSEKNKVHTLLSTIQSKEAFQLSAIPKEQLAEIEQLQSEINQYQTILQKNGEHGNEEKFNQYSEKLISLQVDYHQLNKSIEQNYPEYLQLKQAIPKINLQTLQNRLNQQEAIISYTIAPKKLYILCIASKQNIYFQQVPISNEFVKSLEKFIDEGILGMNRKTYVGQAYELYQLLIEPIKDKLKENNIRDLLIIPDSQLLELPFELLLTSETSFRTSYSHMPYLLTKYNIRYHYSATLRHYQQERNPLTPNLPPRFLGFAPVYDERQFSSETSEALPAQATRDISIQGMNYKALLYSEKEVKDIEENFQQKGWQSQIFLRSQANLSEFKEKIRQFQPKYLHIAAHGVSNQEKNVLGILFSPNDNNAALDKTALTDPSNSISLQPRQQSTSSSQNAILYAHELYQLQLKSDLVFLSCCKSGAGKIAEGEGILSLNRGLLYSGVSNIVFTLFKIYDKTAAIFAHHFYDYLLNQKDSYAEALRYAKLQLLKEDLPPRYWGGFLLLGE